MVFNLVDFEDYKPFVQQVQLLVRVQQEVILAAFMIRFQHIQEVSYVELLITYPFGFQYRPVVRVHKLIESVERRYKIVIILYPVNEQRNGIG